ncbi:response regulator [Neotamlana laminarinivorans]|uniref:histidine kinase n=1 Tax=Neotamlana laminarinivorans TaxID=2883124 RepID=A0A9X1L3R1_9FLAO|nr:response regulator [Tamlana laminarinivorans]MCB4797516.1 response regulator [Tamlana laminarinivorans]
MGFSSKFNRNKRTLSYFVLFSIAIIFVIAYCYIESILNIEVTALILFVLSISQIFVLQFFLKNQLKNKIIAKSQKLRIDELNKSLDKSNKIFEHKSINLINMSYEVRTPLNTILGMLKMLSESDLDQDQILKVEIAEYSSKHLLQFFNLVINNEEIKKNEFELNKKAVDLKSDLVNLFKVFEYQAWEHNLDFEYEFLSENKNNRFMVLADSERIQLILINLVNNAIKFTDSGKISIIIDQTIEINDDQIITFYVKDTGMGMKPEEIKYFLGNTKNKNDKNKFINEYKGWGVGLSISYYLVENMGGELKLESKEREGTTFYFTLQLKKTLNIKNEIPDFIPIPLNKINVLVAEDNRMNQKVIQFLLERNGAQCTFAKNGVEAIDLYNVLDFDIIFMDIYMPDMDGYEATKQIKETKKYAENKTPIIAVSASAFEEDIIKAKKAGINEFLAKPIDVDKLKYILQVYTEVDVAKQ